jgi:ubiquinone/menaquinone biosynthesis C-methylase UbiE
VLKIDLDFNGERVVPDKTETSLYKEHIDRYQFASKFIRDNKILDLACGTGYGSHYLINKGAREVVGVDISPEAIEYAKNHYYNENLNYICADALELPFSDGSFDAIVSFETIEHLQNDEKFIAQCHRIIKKDGLLIISTPNKRFWSPEQDQPCNEYHFREYSAPEFEELLASYFRDIELYGQKNINLIKKSFIDKSFKLISIIPKGNLINQKILNIKNNKRIKPETPDRKDDPVKRTEEPLDEIKKYKESKYNIPKFIIALCKKL